MEIVTLKYSSSAVSFHLQSLFHFYSCRVIPKNSFISFYILCSIRQTDKTKPRRQADDRSSQNHTINYLSPFINSYFYFCKFLYLKFCPQRNKSHHGEELPYVFGVPLGGPTSLFNDSYIEEERLLSEIVMTYFRNFAYTG